MSKYAFKQDYYAIICIILLICLEKKSNTYLQLFVLFPLSLSSFTSSCFYFIRCSAGTEVIYRKVLKNMSEWRCVTESMGCIFLRNYRAVCNLYKESEPLLICQAVPAGNTNFSITDIKSSSSSCFFFYLDNRLV